jgi:hypothetical protein
MYMNVTFGFKRTLHVPSSQSIQLLIMRLRGTVTPKAQLSVECQIRGSELSLWQNTWENQCKGRKIYFGSWFQRFQSWSAGYAAFRPLAKCKHHGGRGWQKKVTPLLQPGNKEMRHLHWCFLLPWLLFYPDAPVHWVVLSTFRAGLPCLSGCPTCQSSLNRHTQRVLYMSPRVS